jgi:sulfate adenylyltransferase
MTEVVGSEPHGGVLVDLLVDADRGEELRVRAAASPSWRLTARQLCDLELLSAGGFSPLRTFLGRADYLAVCTSMRLADGTLWPVPVTLDVPAKVPAALGPDGVLALRDRDGALLGVLHVTEVFTPDLRDEAAWVFGTVDPAHPGVDHLLHHTHPVYVTGRLELLRAPVHDDFRQLRHSPRQLRVEFERRGWTRVVAFNTRNPMHRAHQEVTLRALAETGANLLIHPIVGVTRPGDIDPATRVRCYQTVLPSYPRGRVMLSLLPLAMRMAGPREALWHAIIRKNYGITHFIVGRDHAGPADVTGRPFYGPYDAQELVRRHAAELGVGLVAVPQLVYVDDLGKYLPEDEVPAGARTVIVSGTEIRRRLKDGDELPEWFTPAAVVAILRRSAGPIHRSS